MSDTNQPAISNSPTTGTTLTESSSLANVYFLLARLWNHEVDADTLRQLLSDQVAKAYVEAGGWLPAVAEIDDALVDELAIQYCGCFLGPKGHLPPHQSVVAASRFQGDCCDSIKEFAKLVDPPNLFGDHQQRMVDHASFLLTAMGKLHLDLQVAIDQGDDEALQAIDGTRIQFFQQHLFWLIEYCSAATARTPSEFFGGLFAVTESFLRSEPS